MILLIDNSLQLPLPHSANLLSTDSVIQWYTIRHWYGFSKTKAVLDSRESLGTPIRAHAFPSQVVSVYTIVLLRSFGPGGFAAEHLGVNDPFDARPGTGD